MSLNKKSGDDAWMDSPVPIPNTVVKHPEAESTCLVTGWEDRKPLVKEVMQCFAWLFCCCRQDSAHVSMRLPAAGIACGLENIHAFSHFLPDNSQLPVGDMRRIAFCSEIC